MGIRPSNVAVRGLLPRSSIWLAGVALFWSTAALPAQDEAPPVILHVYANLIQVPVLVLSESRRPLPPIDPQRFTVSLNSGRAFRPTHVRLEGDDPIDLSILVDVRSGGRDFLAHLPEALTALVSTSLRPQDHVTLYTLGCDLTRYVASSVPNALVLRTSAETAIRKNRRRPGHHCAEPAHLWDTMAYIARTSALPPSRAVLLALTDGSDDGSSLRWSRVGSLAAAKSLTIFGLTEPDNDRFRNNLQEDPLTTVCEFTGGMVIHSQPGKLSDSLARFIAMLRDRYIVSFPRPDTLRTGPPVELKVSLLKMSAFIRISGIAVPIADAAILADPNTLRSDPAHAPEIGKRRGLTRPP